MSPQSSTAMLAVDTLLILQAMLGTFDNLWHHEWQARLPRQRGARRELALHAGREALYGAVFLALGWWALHGLWALALTLVLALEVVITLADFLEEDRTRRLPPLERVLHAVLAVCYGLFVGLLAPMLWQWWQQPTALVAADRGAVTWLFTAFALGVWSWSLRNAWAVRRLAREPQAAAPPLPRGAAAVLVCGGTGFIGTALVTRLRGEGRRVIVLTRDVRAARARFDGGVEWVESLDAIAPETRIEAIVHLAGARVLGRPWTRARRRVLLESRTRVTIDIVALARRLEERPRVLIAASAVGYYGVPPRDAVCDEDAPPMPGVFQSDLCVAVEHEARRAEALGLRVVPLRLGIVLGRGDGAYPPQALAARLGLLARIGGGGQPLPWIHLDDAVGLIRWALDHADVHGPVNAVAPERCTQAEFAAALAASFGRRVHLATPAAPLRWLAGEMSTLLVDGQPVVPRRAMAGGYRYAFPTLAAALRQLADAEGKPDLTR